MKNCLTAAALIPITVFLAVAPIQAVSLPPTPEAPRTGALIANVNVRSEPDIRGSVISGLPKSTRVQIWQERNGWVQVTARPPAMAISGWVFGRYVKTGAPPPAEPTQTQSPAAKPAPSIPIASPKAPAVAPMASPSPPSQSISLATPPVAQSSEDAAPSLSKVIPLTGDPALVSQPPAPPKSMAVAPSPAVPKKIAPIAAAPPSPTPDRYEPPNPWPWLVRFVMLMAAILALAMAIGHARRLGAMHSVTDRHPLINSMV